MPHGTDHRRRKAADRGWRAPWLVAGLLATSALACYPDPDDLRPHDNGSGGHGGGGGGTTGAGVGGATTGAGGAGAGGTAATGGTPGAGGTTGGTGGRAGAGGTSAGAGGAAGTRAGTGGSPGAGGASTGAGGARGTGGAGTGGATLHCGGQPCGGNVIGTWNIVLSCAGPQPDSVSCPGETVSYAGIQRVGTITFAGDGSYTEDETDSGSYVIETPALCLTQNGYTCADFDAGYKALAPPQGTMYASASCAVSAIGCRCVLGVFARHVTDTGLYGVNGTKLTTTSNADPNNPSVNDFCIEGTTLRLIYPDSTVASPQELLLQKQ